MLDSTHVVARDVISIVSLPPMRSTLLALLAMICLVGCGKRGPLYLPDGPSQAQGTPAAVEATQRR